MNSRTSFIDFIVALGSKTVHYEPNSLVVRIGFDKRAELIAAESGTYYLTGHYVKHPTVLVRLNQISQKSLEDLLNLAWRHGHC